jgi:hypothetical protein
MEITTFSSPFFFTSGHLCISQDIEPSKLRMTSIYDAMLRQVGGLHHLVIAAFEVGGEKEVGKVLQHIRFQMAQGRGRVEVGEHRGGGDTNHVANADGACLYLEIRTVHYLLERHCAALMLTTEGRGTGICLVDGLPFQEQVLVRIHALPGAGGGAPPDLGALRWFCTILNRLGRKQLFLLVHKVGLRPLFTI